ncbi:MAG: helix-turn-helix domain-containing protein, partial [Alphaproteobacteria bacterium]|nr:helix-turn-helix domain-containing protein [Alphaproteobacteria bacterium]
ALPAAEAAALRDIESHDSTQIATRGVAIIGQSLRRLQGQIAVTSEHRTTIVVTLPVDRIQPEDDTSVADPRPATAPDAAEILVVEDDADLRRFLQDMLTAAGPVRAVGSLAAARRAIDRNPIRLVLCDAMLPDGRAFDFAQSLKSDPTTDHITVIFLTALQDDDAMQAGQAAWADDYITKPFDPADLLQRVHLRLRAAERVRSRTEAAIGASDARGAVDVDAAPFDQRLMHRFEAFLADNLSDPDATVAAAAEACGVSARMLQRKLDALFGQSFTDLLTARRMAQATLLLRRGDHSVAEVATACGYRNLSSFSRRFRAYYGRSPSTLAQDQ